MNINITNNGNKKLLTKNKYCREDININTQVASSVNLFEYYKTIADASCDLTEIFPTVEHNNYKIAAYFTLGFDVNYFDGDTTFGRDIILKSSNFDSDETIYTTVVVSGEFDGSSGAYYCYYKAANGTRVEFANGSVDSSSVVITLALNTWCKAQKGYIVSTTTSEYPAVYLADFTGSMSEKQVSKPWGNIQFQNLPMNVKIK